METKNDLKVALLELGKSFSKVRGMVDSVEFEDGKDINDYIVGDYPFHCSFDELDMSVSEWIESVICKLDNN